MSLSKTLYPLLDWDVRNQNKRKICLDVCFYLLLSIVAELCVIFLSQLLDVFGQKSNVSLVFDFMETDLEVRLLVLPMSTCASR